jgi:hypothetical protein
VQGRSGCENGEDSQFERAQSYSKEKRDGRTYSRPVTSTTFLASR